VKAEELELLFSCKGIKSLSNEERVTFLRDSFKKLIEDIRNDLTTKSGLEIEDFKIKNITAPDIPLSLSLGKLLCDGEIWYEVVFSSSKKGKYSLVLKFANTQSKFTWSLGLGSDLIYVEKEGVNWQETGFPCDIYKYGKRLRWYVWLSRLPFLPVFYLYIKKICQRGALMIRKFIGFTAGGK
jgi:hypothetical protein